MRGAVGDSRGWRANGDFGVNEIDEDSQGQCTIETCKVAQSEDPCSVKKGDS